MIAGKIPSGKKVVLCACNKAFQPLLQGQNTATLDLLMWTNLKQTRNIVSQVKHNQHKKMVENSLDANLASFLAFNVQCWESKTSVWGSSIHYQLLYARLGHSSIFPPPPHPEYFLLVFVFQMILVSNQASTVLVTACTQKI